MARPDLPNMSVATLDSLIRAVLQELLDALLVPGTLLGEVQAQPGVVAELPDLRGGTKLGRSMPRSFNLASHTASSLVGLGPAGHVLHVPGVHEPDV